MLSCPWILNQFWSSKRFRAHAYTNRYSLVIYSHRFVEFFIHILLLPPWRARSSRSLRVERGDRDIIIVRIKLGRWAVSIPRWQPKRAFNTNRFKLKLSMRMTLNNHFTEENRTFFLDEDEWSFFESVYEGKKNQS